MLPPLLQHLNKLNYAIFTKNFYDLNIVGIRNLNGKIDAFDDLIAVVYKSPRGWHQRMWPATTDPGAYYLLDQAGKANPKGTAILKKGQYRSVYEIGTHGSTKYKALVQTGREVTVWRDRNLDKNLDYKNPDTGYFGINIHASSSSPYSGNKVTNKVGVWSAGCQVFQEEVHFREFMNLCEMQIKYHPTWTKFTYTLIERP